MGLWGRLGVLSPVPIVPPIKLRVKKTYANFIPETRIRINKNNFCDENKVVGGQATANISNFF